MDRILRAVLLKWPDAKAGFDHYAVLITYELAGAFLIEKTPDGIRCLPFNYDPHWHALASVNDGGVAARLKYAMSNHRYDALLANCEQFARYIVEGREYSTQARVAGLVALAVGTALVAPHSRSSR